VSYVGKRVMVMSVGKRKRGRMKRRWSDSNWEDLESIGVVATDAADRSKWGSLVRTRGSKPILEEELIVYMWASSVEGCYLNLTRETTRIDLELNPGLPVESQMGCHNFSPTAVTKAIYILSLQIES